MVVCVCFSNHPDNFKCIQVINEGGCISGVILEMVNHVLFHYFTSVFRAFTAFILYLYVVICLYLNWTLVKDRANRTSCCLIMYMVSPCGKTEKRIA